MSDSRLHVQDSTKRAAQARIDRKCTGNREKAGDGEEGQLVQDAKALPYCLCVETMNLVFEVFGVLLSMTSTPSLGHGSGSFLVLDSQP